MKIEALRTMIGESEWGPTFNIEVIAEGGTHLVCESLASYGTDWNRIIKPMLNMLIRTIDEREREGVAA